MPDAPPEATRTGDRPADSALDIVLVHYRTPDLLLEAAAALREDAEPSGLRPNLLVADNGSREQDRQRFAAAGLTVLFDGGNHGYAGGVNRGVAAGEAPWVVVMNPDVLVRPGCLGALREALRGGAECAGPRFFWDRGERLLLPPNERHNLGAELLALTSRWGVSGAVRHRRRWRQHARACWQATRPIRCFELSGALLAFPRAVWNRVGPFDEGYRLYFEETEWLLRFRRRGLRAEHVPAARAVHLYNRSAAAEPRTAAWYAASRERFRLRAHGSSMAAVLDRLEQTLPAPGAEGTPVPLEGPGLGSEHVAFARAAAPAAAELWVEVSPAPLGVPAAAERLPASAQGWILPPETAATLEPGRWSVRLVDDSGAERFFGTFKVSAAGDQLSS